MLWVSYWGSRCCKECLETQQQSLKPAQGHDTVRVIWIYTQADAHVCPRPTALHPQAYHQDMLSKADWQEAALDKVETSRGAPLANSVRRRIREGESAQPVDMLLEGGLLKGVVSKDKVYERIGRDQ